MVQKTAFLKFAVLTNKEVIRGTQAGNAKPARGSVKAIFKILVPLMVVQYAGAADNSMSEAIATSTRQLSTNYKNMAVSLKVAAAGLEEAQNENRKLTAKLNLLLLIAPDYTQAIQIILALIERRTAAAQRKATHLLIKGPAAVATEAYAAGRIDEFVAIWRQAPGNDKSTNACIKPSAGGNYKPAFEAACKAPDYNSQQSTEQTLSAIAEAQLPSSAALAAQATDCKLATNGLTNYIGRPGNTQAIKWGDGILTADAIDDLRAASWSDNIPKNPSLTQRKRA
uniref:Variant surface glycoprotein n=1 Tax=Trypanosoma brucei TaxID=5691 RepID=A0A1V0FYF5_9TRYP|nr:variant surface glycoprotein [Trypanosoma brucei]